MINLILTLILTLFQSSPAKFRLSDLLKFDVEYVFVEV